MKKDGEIRTLCNLNPPDCDLLTQIISGDDKAFESLFKSYYQIMVDFGFLYVKDVAVAENIVQEVFVKIWTNRGKLNPEIALKAYLYRATKNKAIDVLRHQKVTRSKAEEFFQTHRVEKTPEENICEKEMVDFLIAEIDKLPKKCKTIFLMSKYEKLKYAEIAEMLNVSVRTVENHLVRAMRFLRRRILEMFLSLIILFFL